MWFINRSQTRGRTDRMLSSEFNIALNKQEKKGSNETVCERIDDNRDLDEVDDDDDQQRQQHQQQQKI